MNRGWPRYPSEAWPVIDVTTVRYPGTQASGQALTDYARLPVMRKLARRYRLEHYARHEVFQRANSVFFWWSILTASAMAGCAVSGADSGHYVGALVAVPAAWILRGATGGWYPGRGAARRTLDD